MAGLEERETLSVMSLGPECFTARFLADVGARTFAGPFDWMFSSPATVAHAMADGGAALLDRSLCTEVAGDAGAKAGHQIYGPMLGRHVVFNHHNPGLGAGSSDDDAAYFVRAAARLAHQLSDATRARKLFVVCSLEKRGALDDSSIDALFRELALHPCAKAAGSGGAELVVVKIYSPGTSSPSNPVGPVGPSLVRRSVLAATEGSASRASLRLHALRCRGGVGRDGLTLTDALDRADLEAILFPAGAFDRCADDIGDVGGAPLSARKPVPCRTRFAFAADPFGPSLRWQPCGVRGFRFDGYLLPAVPKWRARTWKPPPPLVAPLGVDPHHRRDSE
jgi:hypothetical protein